MQLTLSQSTIRSFRSSDAASLMKHCGIYSVARNMGAMPHPYTLQHAEEWIGIASGGKPESHFAITIDDEVVGGIGLHMGDPERRGVCDHCAEIGYWLGESFWGRGIVSEALVALTEWAFTELGVVRLYAPVFARNAASARILEKAGYAFEGRLHARYFRDGEFIDGLLYAKVRLPR
ncbi:MAG: GNAT family N-acetyltransferase [Chthoniobacter sp.]|nr:GNAT family N-acetyltransferase [Chthoniobacter sp.]